MPSRTSLWSRVSFSSETKLLALPDPSYRTQLPGRTGASSESSDEEGSQLTRTSRFRTDTRALSTHLYISWDLFHLCLGSAWVLAECPPRLWLSSPPMLVWEEAICKLLAYVLVAPLGIPHLTISAGAKLESDGRGKSFQKVSLVTRFWPTVEREAKD